MIGFWKRTNSKLKLVIFSPLMCVAALTACRNSSRQESMQGASGMEPGGFSYERLVLADTVQEVPPYVYGGFKSENLLTGGDWREINGWRDNTEY